MDGGFHANDTVVDIDSLLNAISRQLDDEAAAVSGTMAEEETVLELRSGMRAGAAAAAPASVARPVTPETAARAERAERARTILSPSRPAAEAVLAEATATAMREIGQLEAWAKAFCGGASGWNGDGAHPLTGTCETQAAQEPTVRVGPWTLLAP